MSVTQLGLAVYLPVCHSMSPESYLCATQGYLCASQLELPMCHIVSLNQDYLSATQLGLPLQSGLSVTVSLCFNQRHVPHCITQLGIAVCHTIELPGATLFHSIRTVCHFGLCATFFHPSKPSHGLLNLHYPCATQLGLFETFLAFN